MWDVDNPEAYAQTSFYLTDPDETDVFVFYAEFSDDNNWLDTLSFTTEDTQTIVGFNVEDYQNDSLLTLDGIRYLKVAALIDEGGNEREIGFTTTNDPIEGGKLSIDEDFLQVYIASYNGEIIEFERDFGIDEASIDIAIRYDQNLDQTIISLNNDGFQINDFVTIEGEHSIYSAQFDGDEFELSLGDVTNGPIYLSDDDDEFTGAKFFENTIYGMGGDDDLTGGDLEDVIYGGDGRDNFYPSGGNDSFGGEAGDRVRFEDHEAGVFINQENGTIDDGLGNTLTIDGIEYFNGTKFDDVFYSKDTFAHWKAFNGVGGDDEIFLADGLDWIAVDHWNNDDGEINKLIIHNYNSLERHVILQQALDTYGVYTFTDVINVYDNNYGYDTNHWYEEIKLSVDSSESEEALTYLGIEHHKAKMI